LLVSPKFVECYFQEEITMLTRTRKAFTLLELMIAFVIMAILSAVAIPSLISVAQGDRAQANDASALNLADAAYYAAVAADTSGAGTNAVTYTGTPAETAAGAVAVESGTVGTGPCTVVFTFGTDPTTVTVQVGDGTDGAAAPYIS
jgi:prepilin-type N-terminal cleavage/methylation domain-containing protein